MLIDLSSGLGLSNMSDLVFLIVIVTGFGLIYYALYVESKAKGGN